MKQGGKWNVGVFAFIFGGLGCIIGIISMATSDRVSSGSFLSGLLNLLVAVVFGAVVGGTIALARNVFFSQPDH